MVCCNPASPHHWFYQDVLKHLKEKNGLYVHFTMDDNLTLSDEVKKRYETMYSGVFKKRFIEGKSFALLLVKASWKLSGLKSESFKMLINYQSSIEMSWRSRD